MAFSSSPPDFPPTVGRDFTFWILGDACFVGAYRLGDNRWEVLHIQPTSNRLHAVYPDRGDAEAVAAALAVLLAVEVSA
jgi:hypothetical protein